MKASCQCGRLTAQIDPAAEPIGVACHCHDCQRRSGSPFGALAYMPEDMVSITGNRSEFTRATDAGNEFTNGFCPSCGSTVYAYPSKYPGMVGIAYGALAGELLPAPVRSVFERSAAAWVTLSQDMDHHPVGKDS